MNLSIALCAHLWVTGRFKVCQANPCLAVRIRRRAGGGCAGGGARLRATGGADAPLHLLACVESETARSSSLGSRSTPDPAQSHLAMGRVHAGRGPQVGPTCSPAANRQSGEWHYPPSLRFTESMSDLANSRTQPTPCGSPSRPSSRRHPPSQGSPRPAARS